MADKKNLCAQIDIALHNRVTEEKDRLEMTTSQYIAALLTEYYKMKDENGGINMTGSRTMAFQIPEELFQRIKTHLARETARTGVKLTQRDFVLGLIEQALAEAEASLAPQEAPESTEEAPEDNGAAGTTPDASEASTAGERHSGHRTITQGVKARGRRTHRTITIQEVSLFPQGYAAVLTQTELLDEPSVIVADIGGWTVDLMRLDNRIPNAASCRSLELGMIRCIDEISEQVRRLFGLSMTTAQIESALRGSSGGMDERIRAVIHAQAGKYARNLLSAVTESGLDIRAMPAIFLGGGAALLKRHLSATDGLCRPLILDDVSLNAKGYERLVGQMSRGVGNGR